MNLTEVVPEKLAPDNTTKDPTPAADGVRELIMGEVINVKLVGLVAVIAPTVTVTRPVVAPVGTVAVI